VEVADARTLRIPLTVTAQMARATRMPGNQRQVVRGMVEILDITDIYLLSIKLS
jgi:hypothetical protein